jgi:transposase
MNAREQRGVELADKVSIKPVTKGVRGKWIVPSATGSGRYTVDLNGAKRCTCPDYELRRCKCKHIFAVEYTIRRQIETETHHDGATTVTETVTETLTTTTPDATTQTVTETKKRTYRQNWPAYNTAQTTEKSHFQLLLHELCKGLPEAPRGVGKSPGGRKPLAYADALFSAAFKVYSTVSGRRFISDLHDAHSKGYVSKCVHFNSIFNCLESDEVTPLLHDLIKRSSLPLKGVECDFAVDSSGFSGSKFDNWFYEKYDGSRQNFTKETQVTDWLKLHLMCGVKTNIVTSVEVSGRHANDGPFLPALVDDTAENFAIREVSADRAYSTIKNLHAVRKHKAMPYIPFKSNSTGEGHIPGAKVGTGGDLWLYMWRYFTFHTDEFLEHYHKRSNVESTFSMIKGEVRRFAS